jgi:hypothetical protein
MQSLQKIKDFGLLVGQANKLGMAEVKLNRVDAVSLLAEINMLLAYVIEKQSTTEPVATSSVSGGDFN